MSAGLERVLIVGASLAGLRAAERLRADGFDGALTVLGDEPHAPYDRPPLSKELLSGARQPDDISLRAAPDLGIDWALGEAAVALELERRVVRTDGGRELAFDGLVIATGSAPRRLAGLDPRLPNVFELRTLEDALALRAALAGRPHVLLVGAGFIGIEVAATARALGAEVTVVSLDPPLAVAGELVSGACAGMLADHGVATRIGRRVRETVCGERFEAAVLDDGTRIEPDLVVSAVGALPRVSWLEGSGLLLDDGVVCDATTAAIGAQRIVAAGDVLRWPNPLFDGRSMRIEHWTNAVESGAAAARTLLFGASPETEHRTVPSFWSDHFGIRLQSVGLPALADRFELVEGSPAAGRFAAAAYSGERLVGCVAYGMPKALIAHRMQLARGGIPATAA